ncbi:MAG: alpha/beta fold hydrolase [Ignavibacteriaceae bacterium]
MRAIFLIIIMGMMMNVYAQLPPLIDREIFFGDPELSGAQISPDGRYITFIKPYNNVRNIWIKERNQKFEEARPLTADDKRPISGYFWSRDSRYVLYVQDKGGDENFRVYAIDPAKEGSPVPPALDLTPMENVRAMIIDVPKNNPNEIIIGLNDRNPELHDVYKINLTTGERTLLRKNDDNIIGWTTDLNGELKLGLRILPDGGSEILKIDGDKLEQIFSVSNEEDAYPVRFTEDGQKFYLVTNKGNADKSELLLFDLKTGKTELIEKDPLDEVDFGNVLFSEITNEIIATTYEGDRLRIYPKNEKFAKDLDILRKKLPEGELSLRSETADENIWLVGVSRDVDPGSVYLYDRTTGEAELLYKSRPTLPTEHLANMKAIRYEARDGLSIPAYLTLPKGVNAKNLPVVMFIHGGPWARDYWGYDSYAQFLANRGYAVLQPNFRGSTGYGKKFLNSGNKTWGRGAMQHDITDAVNWLINEGIADPKRVSIAGGSYGGYATLAGLAFTPDLYACGFSIVGPSSILTLLNSIPPYWAPVKKIFDVRVGDMNIPEENEMLKKQSPLYYSNEIKAPLYVVQGANDPRVKKAESDQIVVALRDQNRQVEYMVAPDEGHGFAGLENRLAMTVAMEQFLAKHLGGRVQTEMSDAVGKKLKDITVDIKTVSLPKKEEPTGIKYLSSFDGGKLIPGKNSYVMKISAGGQNIEMNMSREITKTEIDGKKVFVVLDEYTGMMAGKDSLIIDASTLLPLDMKLRKPMATINVKFEGNTATGSMVAGPQNIPVNIKSDKPFVSEGSGLEIALRSVDLKVGEKAEIGQFELMASAITLYLAEMKGTEKVTAGGKEYETKKITVTEKESGNEVNTFWFDSVTRNLIKMESKLPAQMGGGMIIMELVK